MKNTINKTFVAISLFPVLLPAVSKADNIRFRHVLGCVADGPMLNYELATNFDTQSLNFSDGTGTVHDLKVPAFSSAVGTSGVFETPETVNVAGLFMQSVRLSDGSFQSVGAPLTPVTRIQLSYGLGGVTALQPGWAYIYAVRNTAGDSVKLIYQNSPTPPGQPHRYLGSFFLKLSDTCISTPSDPSCTTTPPSTLPSSCVTSLTGCPSNYGRLIGIDLAKVYNKYFYRMQGQVSSSCPAGKCVLLNLNPFAIRQSISAEGGTGATTVYFDSISGGISPDRRGTFPVSSSGLSIDVSNTNSIWLVGHEEERGLYE